MPLIRRGRIPLPLKHMPQMPPTLGTHNLRPRHPKRAIRMPRHRAGDTIEVRRPSATTLELVARFVQGRGAGGAGVDAGAGHVFVVFAREGRFGAFFADHAELLGREDGLPFRGGFGFGVAGLGLVGHVVGGGGGEEGAEEGEGGPRADQGEGVVGGELGEGFGNGLVGEDEGAG